VARIAQQRVALQVRRGQPFAEGDRLLDGGLVQAVRLPDGFRRLDDEGRGAVVELVDVRREPAVLGPLDEEVEGVEQPCGAQPDEAVGPRHDVGPEDGRVLLPDARIDAVAGDDQVGVGIVLVALDLGVEDELDVQRLAAPLQDVEQLLAPDADEPVAAAADAAALKCSSMSSQWLKATSMASAVSASRARMVSIVASLNTTPQAKVS
jgi:hypothetical protein